jgi:hypothetical protein
MPTPDGAAGRSGKANRRTPGMYVDGKSDGSAVPAKQPNKAGGLTEEAAEGRGPVKGNTGKQNASRTQGRSDAHSALERVRKAAKSDKNKRFTALLHHVSVDRLREACLPSRVRFRCGRVEDPCGEDEDGRLPSCSAVEASGCNSAGASIVHREWKVSVSVTANEGAADKRRHTERRAATAWIQQR